MANKQQYFQEHLIFLREGYKEMTIQDLTTAFNAKFGMDKTESAIQTLMNKKGIRCGRKHAERFIKRNKLLTDEQRDFVVDAYKRLSISDVTTELNKEFGTNFKVKQLIAYVANHNIESGRRGCFSDNNEPWNKGLKGKGICKPNAGSFKPGNMPVTTLPLYSERLSKDDIIEIKVPCESGTKYVPKQRYIYEQTHGKIPEGFVVTFRDGNRTNFDPKNLIAISRSELMAMCRNEYRKQPNELKPTVLALSKLQAGISAKRKEIEHV